MEWNVSQDELEHYYTYAELYGTHRTDGNPYDDTYYDEPPVFCDDCNRWFTSCEDGNAHQCFPFKPSKQRYWYFTRQKSNQKHGLKSSQKSVR